MAENENERQQFMQDAGLKKDYSALDNKINWKGQKEKNHPWLHNQKKGFEALHKDNQILEKRMAEARKNYPKTASVFNEFEEAQTKVNPELAKRMGKEQEYKKAVERATAQGARPYDASQRGYDSALNSHVNDKEMEMASAIAEMYGKDPKEVYRRIKAYNDEHRWVYSPYSADPEGDKREVEHSLFLDSDGNKSKASELLGYESRRESNPLEYFSDLQDEVRELVKRGYDESDAEQQVLENFREAQMRGEAPLWDSKRGWLYPED